MMTHGPSGHRPEHRPLRCPGWRMPDSLRIEAIPVPLESNLPGRSRIFLEEQHRALPGAGCRPRAVRIGLATPLLRPLTTPGERMRAGLEPPVARAAARRILSFGAEGNQRPVVVPRG